MTPHKVAHEHSTNVEIALGALKNLRRDAFAVVLLRFTFGSCQVIIGIRHTHTIAANSSKSPDTQHIQRQPLQTGPQLTSR